MEGLNYKFSWKMLELGENVQKTMDLNKRMREIISNKSVINIIYSKKCVNVIESKESDDVISLSEKLIEEKMKEIEKMNEEVMEIKKMVENLSMNIENGKRKKKYYSLGS